MSRLRFSLRFLFLGVLISVLVAVIISLPTRVMSSSQIRAALGMQYSLALYLVPNALSFLVSAFVLRKHWATLTSSQILAASIVAVIATAMVVGVLAVLFTPLLGMSERLARPVAIVMMLFPGAVAGQLLRFGNRHATHQQTA
jgi:hypothetical protein